MKRFKFIILDSIMAIREVDAETEQDAEDMLQQNYNDGLIELEPNHYGQVEFRKLSEEDI